MQSSVRHSLRAPLHPDLDTRSIQAAPVETKTGPAKLNLINAPIISSPSKSIITYLGLEENKENIPPSFFASTTTNTYGIRVYNTITLPISLPRPFQSLTNPRNTFNTNFKNTHGKLLEPSTRHRPTSNLQALRELSLEEIKSRSAPFVLETSIEFESNPLPDFEGTGEGSFRPVRSARSAARLRPPKKQKKQQKKTSDPTKEPHVDVMVKLPFAIYEDVD